MVFCGRENSSRRRGQRMGSRLECFRKGFGVGKTIGANTFSRANLTARGKGELEAIASRFGSTGVRRKNKATLINEIVAAQAAGTRMRALPR